MLHHAITWSTRDSRDYKCPPCQPSLITLKRYAGINSAKRKRSINASAIDAGREAVPPTIQAESPAASLMQPMFLDKHHGLVACGRVCSHLVVPKSTAHPLDA